MKSYKLFLGWRRSESRCVWLLSPNLLWYYGCFLKKRKQSSGHPGPPWWWMIPSTYSTWGDAAYAWQWEDNQAGLCRSSGISTPECSQPAWSFLWSTLCPVWKILCYSHWVSYLAGFPLMKEARARTQDLGLIMTSLHWPMPINYFIVSGLYKLPSGVSLREWIKS